MSGTSDGAGTPPSLLTAELLGFVGHAGPVVDAPEPVERGAVRRYAQAIMDDDPAFDAAVPGAGDGMPMAPALFATHMFRRPFGSPDPLAAAADDPNYDGAIGSSIRGLPELPLRGRTRLNGGSEVELFRYAVHGERLRMQSRYASITERQSSKGPMLIVVVETRYFADDDDVLLTARSTALYR